MSPESRRIEYGGGLGPKLENGVDEWPAHPLELRSCHQDLLSILVRCKISLNHPTTHHRPRGHHSLHPRPTLPIWTAPSSARSSLRRRCKILTLAVFDTDNGETSAEDGIWSFFCCICRWDCTHGKVAWLSETWTPRAHWKVSLNASRSAS